MKFIDPDGQDVYLIIYYTKDGDVGHVAIAFDNYEENVDGEMVSDGTVNIYDFGPSEDVDEENSSQNVWGVKDVDVNVEKSEFYEKYPTFGSGEEVDGILQINADYKTTNSLSNAFEEDLYNDEYYNGTDNNCSNYAKHGVTKVPGFESVSGMERIDHPRSKRTRYSITPNFLFKDTKKVIDKNPSKGKVIKENDHKNEIDFIDAVTGGRVKDKSPGE